MRVGHALRGFLPRELVEPASNVIALLAQARFGSILLLVLVLLAGAAIAHAQVAQAGASAQLHNASGLPLAAATFRQSRDEVLISLSFPDRSALSGTHAIQIHQVARCDPPDFASAGPIFNPSGKPHGLRNPDGPMNGDLPSMVIGSEGVAVYNIAAPLVTIGPGSSSLLGGQGTSLVIFSGPDDDASQPEGNAGARIACGVIVAGPPVPQSSRSNPLAFPADNRTDLTAALLIGAIGGLLITAGVLLRRS